MSENVVIKKDRTVTVPASEAKIGVQYDHNVNAITFDCPRYPDDDRSVDMSTMQIYINYMLPDKTLGSYLAENVKVDTNNPDTIHFDWKITRNVTQVKGALQALVCIKKVDAEGNELYHWNTDLIQSFRVGEGMECLETISSDYADVISQLLVNMNAVVGEFEALSADVTARTSEETLQGLVNNAASDEKLGSIVNAYMEANPVGINVDDTLSVSGDAADAKITGDRISELKSDLTQTANNMYPTDIEWEQGTLNNDGTEADNAYFVRSDYIKFDNRTLYVNPTSAYRITVFFYDESKTFVSKTGDLIRLNKYQFFENSGYVRFKVRKEPIASVTPATIGNVQISESVLGFKTYYGEMLANTSDRLQPIDGNVFTPLELGYVAKTTAIAVYDDNNTNSVRIIKGLEPYLTIGDVVGLTDYTGLKFQVYYTKEDSTAGYSGWITSDWTCQANSIHYVMIRKTDDSAMTSADIESIKSKFFVNLAEYYLSEDVGNSVPPYWLSHLKAKEATINTLDATVGENGCSFVFWTDMHWTANYKKSPALIRHILKNTGVRDVVCGGDILGGSYTSTETAYNALCDFRNIISKRDYPVLSLRGNHDLTPDGTMYLTDNQFYGAMLKPFDRYANLIRKTYYYRDDETLKIRYYYLDSRAVSSDSLDADQLAWLEANLNTVPSDWSIIVFVHAVHTPANSSSSDTLQPSYPAYQISQALGNANKKSQLIAMIGGHTHRDEITTNYGCLLISVTTDAGGTTASDWDANYPTRTKGTTSEQAFDVFHIDMMNRTIYMTRIGAGSDRQTTY